MINWWSDWSDWQLWLLTIALTFAYGAGWCWGMWTSWRYVERATRVQEIDGKFVYCTYVMLSLQHALILYMLSFNIYLISFWCVVNFLCMFKTGVFNAHMTLLCHEFGICQMLPYKPTTAKKDEAWNFLKHDQPFKALCTSYFAVLRSYVWIRNSKRNSTISEVVYNRLTTLETKHYTFWYLLCAAMPMRLTLAAVAYAIWCYMNQQHELEVIQQAIVHNEKQNVIAEGIAEIYADYFNFTTQKPELRF